MGAIFSQHFEELDATELARTYAAATPFPHIVLDDVFDCDRVGAAATSFPKADGPDWTSYLHLNERKRGNTHLDTWPSELRTLANALMSPPFIAFLEQVTGVSALLPDPSFDGGGLHRSERGGFLNIHTDFTAHHRHVGWERRINVLLYLNEDWEEAWGGQLELWSADMQRCVSRVAPAINRMVIFTTTTSSYHGHPAPLNCPEGTARASMALYYFTSGSSNPVRTTDYRARPGDGLKRVGIYLDKKVLRLYDIVKHRTGASDAVVSRWLSRLSRRRR